MTTPAPAPAAHWARSLLPHVPHPHIHVSAGLAGILLVAAIAVLIIARLARAVSRLSRPAPAPVVVTRRRGSLGGPVAGLAAVIVGYLVLKHRTATAAAAPAKPTPAPTITHTTIVQHITTRAASGVHGWEIVALAAIGVASYIVLRLNNKA